MSSGAWAQNLWAVPPGDRQGGLGHCRTRRPDGQSQDRRGATVRCGVAERSAYCYTHDMTKTIAQRELRNENAKVMDAVAGGETFVVTRNGEPVAELRPWRAGRRTFISRAEVVALAAANVRIDRDQFRADLDAVIDQSW